MVFLWLILLVLCNFCFASTAFVYPRDFVWGTATAAYQVEGAVKVDNRSPSIWDAFAHTAGKTFDGETGDVADDFYHLFREDITSQLCRHNISSFRMSLSWSRLIRSDGTINEDGISHYDAVFDTLESCGIIPFVTLYHWDLPVFYTSGAPLYEGGWLMDRIVDHFKFYANVAFERFGSRVKHWITFNEAFTFCWLGFGKGSHAPGRCSDRSICAAGDSSTEPYICAHNVILAHAAAVELYNTVYRKGRMGDDEVIMMVTNSNAGYAFRAGNADDEAAVERFLIWQLGWFNDPLFFGDYPQVMKDLIKDRLPSFTPEEKQRLISNRPNAFGLNFYTCSFNQAVQTNGPPSWATDQRASAVAQNATGHFIGPRAASDWLFVCPQGFRPLLEWIHKRYNAYVEDAKTFVPIYVTENGVDVPGENDLSPAEAIHDPFRVNFYQTYIASMEEAMKQGVPVRGYFAWSLMDNFEWSDGYAKRFGLVYIQYYENGVPLAQPKRFAKDSLTWYAGKIQIEREKGLSMVEPPLSVATTYGYSNLAVEQTFLKSHKIMPMVTVPSSKLTTLPAALAASFKFGMNLLHFALVWVLVAVGALCAALYYCSIEHEKHEMVPLNTAPEMCGPVYSSL